MDEVMDNLFGELRKDEGLLSASGRVAVMTAMHRAFPAGKMSRREGFGTDDPMF
jgi:hypothetical protein